MQTMQGELSLHGTHCERCGSKMIYFMPRVADEPAYGCSLDVCINNECKHAIIHCPGNTMADPSTRNTYPISNEDYAYITSRDNKTENQLKVLDNAETNSRSKESSLHDTLTKELSEHLLKKIDEVKILESENKILKKENEALKDKLNIISQTNNIISNLLNSNKSQPTHQPSKSIVDGIDDVQKRIKNITQLIEKK